MNHTHDHIKENIHTHHGTNISIKVMECYKETSRVLVIYSVKGMDCCSHTCLTLGRMLGLGLRYPLRLVQPHHLSYANMPVMK